MWQTAQLAAAIAARGQRERWKMKKSRGPARVFSISAAGAAVWRYGERHTRLFGCIKLFLSRGCALLGSRAICTLDFLLIFHHRRAAHVLFTSQSLFLFLISTPPPKELRLTHNEPRTHDCPMAIK
jgi:hypothetical protein